ncbi:hypothetical protein L9F63_009399, partial [Diploptera punctata]
PSERTLSLIQMHTRHPELIVERRSSYHSVVTTIELVFFFLISVLLTATDFGWLHVVPGIVETLGLAYLKVVAMRTIFALIKAMAIPPLPAAFERARLLAAVLGSTVSSSNMNRRLNLDHAFWRVKIIFILLFFSDEVWFHLNGPPSI